MSAYKSWAEMIYAYAKLILPAVLLLVANPQSSGAQSPPAFDPFVFPSGPSRCGYMPLTAKDSAQLVTLSYHFSDGEAMRDDRDIDMTYDSTGAPVNMALLATELTSDGRIVMRPFVIWFGRASGDSTFGIRMVADADRVNLIPDSASSLPKGWERLPSPDAERARSLAIWLRDHRCSRPPPGSRPPTQ